MGTNSRRSKSLASQHLPISLIARLCIEATIKGGGLFLGQELISCVLSICLEWVPVSPYWLHLVLNSSLVLRHKDVVGHGAILMLVNFSCKVSPLNLTYHVYMFH